MRNRLVILSILAILISPASAQQKTSRDPWDKWQFLIGTWKASGGGAIGEGAGTFTFAFDLQKTIILRKSHTDYPATQGRAAFAHDDLVVVYADPSQQFYADYYDNEGHVIRYHVDFSGDGRSCTFISDSMKDQPRFRLTYTATGDNEVAIKFEIAQPNEPQNFKVYVQGTAQRK